MFSRKKETKIDGMAVCFYTDAAVHGSHGKIRVTNRRKGLDNKVVNFVFVGLVTPPELTPSLMEHIWTEAKAQGYVPHGLVDALEVNAAAPEELTDTLAAVSASQALNTQELGRASRTIASGEVALTNLSTGARVAFDPERAVAAEVPGFLRSSAAAPA